MTPKEKAEAMVLKYTILINYDFVSDLNYNDPRDERRNRRVKKDAKKCALAAVDEILNYIFNQFDIYLTQYWREVKQEIEQL